MTNAIQVSVISATSGRFTKGLLERTGIEFFAGSFSAKKSRQEG
jgi:hypothetical protein